MEKTIRNYTKLYEDALKKKQFRDSEQMTSDYRDRLTRMYASEAYRQHNIYPTMSVPHVYAVIAMCLELREHGLSDEELTDFINFVFRKRRAFFDRLIRCINVLPNSYQIAEKWNISDHEKRVKDGSITYDVFEVSDEKIEYRISKCMYVEMFRYYGIRELCKLFCDTDIRAYAGLPKHVVFIRHSDLSDGKACHDEIFDRNKHG